MTGRLPHSVVERIYCPYNGGRTNLAGGGLTSRGSDPDARVAVQKPSSPDIESCPDVFRTGCGYMEKAEAPSRRESVQPGQGGCVGDWELDRVIWRKAAASAAQGNCAEVGITPAFVLVRHSSDPSGPMIRFTRDEWAAFLDGVRGGEFDLSSASHSLDKPESDSGL